MQSSAPRRDIRERRPLRALLAAELATTAPLSKDEEALSPFLYLRALPAQSPNSPLTPLEALYRRVSMAWATGDLLLGHQAPLAAPSMAATLARAPRQISFLTPPHQAHQQVRGQALGSIISGYTRREESPQGALGFIDMKENRLALEFPFYQLA